MDAKARIAEKMAIILKQVNVSEETISKVKEEILSKSMDTPKPEGESEEDTPMDITSEDKIDTEDDKPTGGSGVMSKDLLSNLRVVCIK
jgi:hypothetical protein